KPKPVDTAPSAPPPPPAPPTQGRVLLAVSPWGEVEVDGRPAGVAPPLRHLDLTAGPHTITVRNGDAAPQVRQIDVDPAQPTTLRFRF
ncbi:MAG: serine/threonine protein kinase, partial [Burkholderiales bacterium]|nr:serine/threonine protein kinase [Burkholderiales bacterium]